MSQQSWQPDPVYGAQPTEPPNPYAPQTYGQEWDSEQRAYGQQPAYGYQQPAYGYQQPAYGQQAGFGYQQQVPVWSQPTPVIQHGAWSRTLLVVAGLSVALSGFALIVGAGMAGAGDELAGAIGIVLAVAALTSLVVSAVLLWLTVSGRRRADRGQPGRLRAAGIMATVLGGLALLGAVRGLVDGGIPTSLIGAVLYLVPGIQLIRITSSR